MSEILSEILNRQIAVITLNRPEKHNAFHQNMLASLQAVLDDLIAKPDVRVILLKANGKHFCAGADAAWMQKTIDFSEADNMADAKILGKVMLTLYESAKPTIAVVQGAAYGGGAGLAAACDIVFCSEQARFCFSEVKLGLIPAVISPYVIQAIGARAAKKLFLSAEVFDAAEAQRFGLVHYCLSENALWEYALEYAENLCAHAPLAMADCKQLVTVLQGKPPSTYLMEETAAMIAKKRISAEAQLGLQAFLAKKTPIWQQD